MQNQLVIPRCLLIAVIRALPTRKGASRAGLSRFLWYLPLDKLMYLSISTGGFVPLEFHHLTVINNQLPLKCMLSSCICLCLGGLLILLPKLNSVNHAYAASGLICLKYALNVANSGFYYSLVVSYHWSYVNFRDFVSPILFVFEGVE